MTNRRYCIERDQATNERLDRIIELLTLLLEAQKTAKPAKRTRKRKPT